MKERLMLMGRIAVHDLKSYFVSPIGYVVLALFSVLEGWFFFNHVTRFNDVLGVALMSGRPDTLNQINLHRLVVEPLFKETLMLLLVFLPAVTMRLLAEEKKQKTLELLLTSPLRTGDIVMGKFLSAVSFLLILLGFTTLHPILLFVFGQPGPDLAPLLTGYLGLFLAGACVVSVGLFASSLTENQIVAFVVTVFLAHLFALISGPAPALGGLWGDLLRAVCIKDHAVALFRGFVDTRGLIYLGSFIFFWLFLTQRIVEGTRVGRILSGKTPESRRFLSTTAGTGAVLALVNLFGFLFYTGLDVTPDKISSLSDQSKKAVQWIKEPVELLVFSTQKTPDNVKYMLDSYAFVNRAISYRFVDPEKNPGLAQRYKVDQDGQGVLTFGEGFILIPSIDEQSVTNAILKITQKAHNVVYFLTGHGERDVRDNRSKDGIGLLADQMRDENYRVESLSLEPPHYYIPGNCTLLVVAGPRKGFTEFELKAVGEYLAASGRAVFLLDPPTVTGLEPLLAQWGVEVKQNVLLDVAAPSLVQRALAGMRGMKASPRPLFQIYLKDFPPHPVTADLEGKPVLLSVARTVEPRTETKPGAVRLAIDILARSTDKGWAESDVDGVLKKGLVSRSPDEKVGPHTVALMATRGTETDNSKIAVFGDSDFVSNEYLNQLFNRDLFMNTLAFLGEQAPLVSVRPRRLFASRLDYNPKTMARLFHLSVWVFPSLLLAGGVAAWRIRR
ncbi:MAG: Gldg family protein [Elusimicrobia bacterium]|nr:Gldg family protein [Elusimicrobiota bacterium]